MADPDEAVRLLARLGPTFAAWKLEALDEWMELRPPAVRVTLSTYERCRFIFGRALARAELATLPVASSKVVGKNWLRWLCVEDGALCLAVWFRKVDRGTLLTASYPTGEAVRRQREGFLFADEKEAGPYICGHTVSENLAGDEVAMDEIWYTRETNEGGKRLVSSKYLIWSGQAGRKQIHPAPMLPFVAAAAAGPKYTIKPKTKPAASKPEPRTPRAGVGLPAKAADAAAAEQVRGKERG